MIEFTDASIETYALHRISIDHAKNIVNEKALAPNSDEENDILKRIFLRPFISSSTTYEFKHDVEIELNTLLKLSNDIQNGENFTFKSINIHQHLKSVSKHPNIKDGDLFVVKFKNLQLNRNFYDGLGIYKIENKESFIETSDNGSSEIGISFKKGIGTKRLDKACLILFTEEPYTVFVIDNNSSETDYWQNEFLKVGYRNDHINNTNQFLSLTKSYLTEQLPNEFEVSKADQIDLLNRSVDYFKNHESFDKAEFENEVFQDNTLIESFRSFDSSYRKENAIDIADDFEISQQAVKKQAKVFKSVLKLDKNFHIYIHGDRQLIEQGIEKDGRKYYKIYFDKES
jgi:hypothetical protein